MFEFEYDNFLDKFNGLKIVIRNTKIGRLVGYWYNNETNCISSEYYNHAFNYDEIIGSDFIDGVLRLVSDIWHVAFMDLAYPPKGFDDYTNSYFVGKKEEIQELARKQAEQFLLDYFQVEDMRDLLARDDFFDKQMFVEP